jgi:hypothetical protein
MRLIHYFAVPLLLVGVISTTIDTQRRDISDAPPAPFDSPQFNNTASEIIDSSETAEDSDFFEGEDSLCISEDEVEYTDDDEYIEYNDSDEFIGYTDEAGVEYSGNSVNMNPPVEAQAETQVDAPLNPQAEAQVGAESNAPLDSQVADPVTRCRVCFCLRCIIDSADRVLA